MHTLSLFEPSTTLAIIFTVLGGLGLFLYGIEYMSTSLKNLSGNRLKILIEKATDNIFMGLLTGIAVTVLVQSSSATTVIVIGLISAGLMSLRQAVGVMMGANIGTTVTAFLIGLKINEYSLIFIALGAAIVIFITTKKASYTGGIILGFGMLFLGLELMSLGLEPLAEKDWFETAMISLAEVPILGVLAGTFLTVIVQSSSATIGVVQQVFFDGNIALPGALAVLIGSNIGTTITAILASLSSPREAKQASMFHLLFNLFGSVIFLIFFGTYVKLLGNIENAFLGPNNKLTIAYAHIIFNTVTTIFVLFLVKYFVVLIEKMLPIKEDKDASLVEKLNYDLIISSPVLALESAKGVVIEMGGIAQEMIKTARLYQNDNSEDYFGKIADLENRIDLYDKSIHDYLMEIQSFDLSQKYKQTQVILLDVIRDFERIADHAVNLSEFYQNRYEQDCPLTGKVAENLNHYFDLVVLQVENAILSFQANDKKLAKKVIETEIEIDKLEKHYRRAQLLHKKESSDECNDIHYVDILSNLERISDHCNNIAENVIDPHYLSKERSNPSF
ncbi:MAG TPA: Na/Pi cotransporter family protein [Acholeplasmataceae bacterium]|nr:Na/Pi cotransporter family protein [Acholeplasmataceae bacterium]